MNVHAMQRQHWLHMCRSYHTSSPSRLAWCIKPIHMHSQSCKEKKTSNNFFSLTFCFDWFICCCCQVSQISTISGKSSLPEYTPVTQSILCIFLMYVATIQCLHYSGKEPKNNNLQFLFWHTCNPETRSRSSILVWIGRPQSNIIFMQSFKNHP